MSEYIPDKWVVVYFNVDGFEPILKVLGSWYGGYLGGDSWKLSSGVDRIEEFEDRYDFHNYSGSVYKCYKTYAGMSGYTSSVYESWKNKIGDGSMISILTIDQINERLSNKEENHNV